jgi:2-succinyl-5-enolpyruvyl-6-hydroxy-3-cyclohexene-1-carboxylate synthase
MSCESSVAHANLAAARALVDSLIVAGLRHAVICPGSRSGPIAVAIDERGTEIEIFVLTDERSAGFFALGLARQSGKPPLVICTSGTAAANLVPAAAEGFFAEIPLLLVTADRPPEARDFAASQTIHQAGLFAGHARVSMDLAPPASDGVPLAYYRASAARAFAIATGTPSGPVHVNFPFREPLLPIPLPAYALEPSSLRCVQVETVMRDVDVASVVARIRAAKRGLLVCGPSSRAAETAPALAKLAVSLGWPVLADPLSGLRSDDFRGLALVDAYDVMLRSNGFCRDTKPHLVLRFGGVPTSKPLQQALARWGGEQLLFAAPNTWPDPSWSASEVISCDGRAAAEALTAGVADRGTGRGAEMDRSWTRFWAGASQAVRSALDSALDRLPATFEARVARDLARRLPEGALYFVGNSMPIRDVDTFCARMPRGSRVLANRGANGIDGVLSTALGAAASSGKPTILLLGDLSFLHDAGALQVLARLEIPLLVVVVNNDGGGIFHMLPAVELGEPFERCFATPHGLDLASAIPPGVAGRTEIRRVATGVELDRSVSDWLARPRPLVVEVPSDRQETTMLRASVIADAVAAVESGAGLGS